MIKAKIYKIRFNQIAPNGKIGDGLVWNLYYQDAYAYITAKDIVEAAQYATNHYDELVSKIKVSEGYKIDGIKSVEEYLDAVYTNPDTMIKSFHVKVCGF
jgi:hypothetical protein